MSSAHLLLRRATVDDLPGLKQLWERAHLQVLDLEKRLTEFQIVATDQGDLLGALALRVEGKQGCLHSEAFAGPADADALRQQLWERAQTLARNHGLVRLWTREASPFWTEQGFQAPSADTETKRPASFGDLAAGWRCLQLREESPVAISLEREFEMFQQAQKASTEQMMAQARTLRAFAYVLASIVLLVVVIGGFLLVRKANREKIGLPRTPPAP